MIDNSIINKIKLLYSRDEGQSDEIWEESGSFEWKKAIENTDGGKKKENCEAGLNKKRG